MNLRFLERAKGSAKLCRRAFEAVSECRFDEAEFQTHWLDFLVQWKRTYMNVQQAAKSTPQELQWFGGVNRYRRDEPLLRWLYEARNDEEHHGLADSATNRPASHTFKLLRSGPFNARLRVWPDGRAEMVDENEQPVAVLEGLSPQVSQLHEVTERDGKKKVPPPTTYQGKPIPSEPKLVAALGLGWLETLVAKAEEMPKPSP